MPALFIPGAMSRDFDITILGATGWTATICAEYIIETFLPTTKWCIAGRSQSKLESLRSSLFQLSSSSDDGARDEAHAPEPAIAVLPSLAPDALDPVVRNTWVVVNGIGPYHRYATPIVASCARHGTHYVDFSTETPWIAEMVWRFDDVARATSAVLVPSASISSTPSDLLAMLLVERAGQGDGNGNGRLQEVVCSGRLSMIGMQGGSLGTVLDAAERYGGWWTRVDPWVMSSQPRPPRAGRATEWFGCRRDAVLGPLGASFVATGDQAVVQRSAGLRPDKYGPDFVFREYMPVSGFWTGVLADILTKLGVFLLGFSLFPALLRRVGFAPGSGPDREQSRRRESVEFKAVGYVDSSGKKPALVASFGYHGALTEVSAIMAVEAAASILELAGAEKLMPGGLLTPSSLGRCFVERLQKACIRIEVNEVGRNGKAKMG